MKISKKYKKMIEVYNAFRLDNCDHLDYSDEALLQMYEFESRGVKTDLSKNGFFWCKHNLDLSVTSWKEDLQTGLITKKELLNDEKFPRWWMEKIIEKIGV